MLSALEQTCQVNEHLSLCKIFEENIHRSYKRRKFRFFRNITIIYMVKRKAIAILFLATVLLMFMWKNTPILFELSAFNDTNLSSNISLDCPPCEYKSDEVEPIIELDYQSEIEYDGTEPKIVDPPSEFPDSMYMRNLSQLRPYPQIAITPWKVVENVHMPVDGQDCVRMQPHRQYFPKWTFVIFVKSKSSNFDRRKAIRSTWGLVYYINQVRIEKVFVIGQVEDPTVQKEIIEENDKFGDILQSEGPDDYKNMPIKVTTAMYWASSILPPHSIYASSDDDFVVDLVSILDFIEYQVKFRLYKERKKTHRRAQPEEIRANLPIYCVYYFKDTDRPERRNHSKWFISKSEYSLDQYPPYCGGGFYIMPVAMAGDLYRISRVTKLLAMDDVWVTGILRQKLRRGDKNIFKLEWPRNKPDTRYKRKLWKHLWGDYGEEKNDIAKLLPDAWYLWMTQLQLLPHCKLSPPVVENEGNLREDIQVPNLKEDLKLKLEPLKNM